MKGDRLRVPADAAYLSALGCATYCFARMEWDAVYCGQKLSPGFINTVSRKTAGAIGKNIKKLAHPITEPGKRALYEATVDEFIRLVSRRNDLMHANPATIGSDQRLVRYSTPWQLNESDDLADEFTACSMELNKLPRLVL